MLAGKENEVDKKDDEEDEGDDDDEEAKPLQPKKQADGEVKTRVLRGCMAPAKHLAERAACRNKEQDMLAGKENEVDEGDDDDEEAKPLQPKKQTDGEVKTKKAAAELQQPAKPLQPVSKSVQFLTKRLKTTKPAGMIISSRRGRRGKAKLIPQVDASSLHIDDKKWNSVRGLHKKLSEVTITTEKEVALYGKERFAGPFTTLDANAVCRYGQYLTDVVVYRFSQYFARDRKDLYVESPAFVHSLVDVDKMEVNYENVAHFLKKTSELKAPTWSDRLKNGVLSHVDSYTYPTPVVPTRTIGQRLMLPLSVPLNEHWMLVVIFKKSSNVYIKVLDSMHWDNRELHTQLTQQLVRVTQLMGTHGTVVNITGEEVIPIQQRNLYCFCGFHVIARVWMAATEQTAKKLEYNQVDDLRRYIQYMILSKDVVKHDIFFAPGR